MSLNKCVFIGNLTRDPELKVVAGDKKVVKFTIAVNMRMKGGKTEPLFLNCEAWDSGAVLIATHFSKGDAIVVSGHLRQDTWEKDGQKRTSLFLRVQEFEFPPYRKDKSGKKDSEATAGQPASVVDDDHNDGEEIPF